MTVRLAQRAHWLRPELARMYRGNICRHVLTSCRRSSHQGPTYRETPDPHLLRITGEALHRTRLVSRMLRCSHQDLERSIAPQRLLVIVGRQRQPDHFDIVSRNDVPIGKRRMRPEDRAVVPATGGAAAGLGGRFQ